MHINHFLNINRCKMMSFICVFGESDEEITFYMVSMKSPARRQYRILFVILSYTWCTINCKVDSFDQFSVRTIPSQNLEENL